MTQIHHTKRDQKTFSKLQSAFGKASTIIFDGPEIENRYRLLVKEINPKAKTILDLSHLRSLELYRKRKLDSSPEASFDEIAAEVPDLDFQPFKEEFDSIRRNHHTIMQSDFDQMIVKERFGLENIWNISQIFEDEDIQEAKERLDKLVLNKVSTQRRNILYEADYAAFGEIDNLKYFLREIWNDLQNELPEVCVDLVGQNINQEVMRLVERTPRIRVIVSSY